MCARADFDLFPAIDLRAGRVVRLTEGDFGRETEYSTDPVAVAGRFRDAGARWLHVVDLDGAKAGEPRQAEVARAIVEAVAGGARCQVAGGLRSDAAVADALDAGAARVVVGTAALRDPSFAGRLVERHGAERVAVGLDVRDDLAVGDAWRHGAAGVPVADAIDALTAVGVETFIVTAVARDGRLEGPDVALLGAIVAMGQG
ncbi:MAG TPA: HisA/HisF-related TIM barrel protein, partial [Candidatus Limnocylindrales bacterium]